MELKEIIEEIESIRRDIADLNKKISGELEIEYLEKIAGKLWELELQLVTEYSIANSKSEIINPH